MGSGPSLPSSVAVDRAAAGLDASAGSRCAKPGTSARGRHLLDLALDGPGGLHRVQEVRRASDLQPLVVLVVLQEAGAPASTARADGAAEGLGDRSADLQRAAVRAA